jgi:hypothetical protein
VKLGGRFATELLSGTLAIETRQPIHTLTEVEMLLLLPSESGVQLMA